MVYWTIHILISKTYQSRLKLINVYNKQLINNNEADVRTKKTKNLFMTLIFMSFLIQKAFYKTSRYSIAAKIQTELDFDQLIQPIVKRIRKKILRIHKSITFLRNKIRILLKTLIIYFY